MRIALAWLQPNLSLPDCEKRISLLVQWLRVLLAMQGMQVQSLVGELRSHMLQSNEVHALQLRPKAVK